MSTTRIEGYKRYGHYRYIALQNISRLPLYNGSRDIKTIPIQDFKRHQDHPYTASRDMRTTTIQRIKRHQDYLYRGLEKI